MEPTGQYYPDYNVGYVDALAPVTVPSRFSCKAMYVGKSSVLQSTPWVAEPLKVFYRPPHSSFTTALRNLWGIGSPEHAWFLETIGSRGISISR